MSDDFFRTWHSVNGWSETAYAPRRDSHGSLPIHYSIASYCTETKPENIEKKPVIFQPNVAFNNFHLLSAAMQRNLGDTLPQNEPSQPSKKPTMPTPNASTCSTNKGDPKMTRDNGTSFSTITNFVSSVFNAISASMPAMPFHRRARSFDTTVVRGSDFDECARDSSPPLEPWLTAKTEPQNKNNCTDQSGVLARGNNIRTNDKTEDMSVECRAVAAHCEDKLNKVRTLLTKTEPVQQVRLRQRRPKKVFVEPNSITDNYEDHCAEQIAQLANCNHIECVSVGNVIDSKLFQVYIPVTKIEMAPLAPEVKVEVPKSETTEPQTLPNDIIKTVPASDVSVNGCTVQEKDDSKTPNEELQQLVSTTAMKPACQLIQSCEDKMGKLRALLQERKNIKSILKTTNICNKESDVEEKQEERIKPKSKPIEITKSHSKKYKNPKRKEGKRKCQINRNIKDDMNFGNEIDVPSSVEDSPRIDMSTKFAIQTPLRDSTETLSSSCDFNEIAGRFHNSSTTESEDSFQIVFADDSKPLQRSRIASDCDSEDSFIVFEGSGDNCYTSTDVFGDEVSDEDSDSSDSDSDGDDEGPFKMTNSHSRTVSDLTDESLYEDNAVFEPKPSVESEDEVDCSVIVHEDIQKDELDTKTCSKAPICKKVRFSEQAPKVHLMCAWAYAARQARIGNWEQYTRDRDRFKRRIADTDMAISWVLKPQHRKLVKFQRFMPWWNAQRRQEIAEKKAKEEEEMRKAEEERLKREAEEKLLEEERRKKAEEQRKIEDAVRKTVRELKRLRRVKKKCKELDRNRKDFKFEDVKKVVVITKDLEKVNIGNEVNDTAVSKDVADVDDEQKILEENNVKEVEEKETESAIEKGDS